MSRVLYEDELVSSRLDRRVLSIRASTHSLWHSVPPHFVAVNERYGMRRSAGAI